MTTPTLTIPQLSRMGKETMELVAREGDFFFPKLVCGYFDHMQMATYESSEDDAFGEFLDTLSVLATQGPITFLALTVDSYTLTKGIGPDTTDPDILAVVNGEKRVRDLFEDEHPLATEALAITLVTIDSTKSSFV